MNTSPVSPVTVQQKLCFPPVPNEVFVDKITPHLKFKDIAELLILNRTSYHFLSTKEFWEKFSPTKLTGFSLLPLNFMGISFARAHIYTVDVLFAHLGETSWLEKTKEIYTLLQHTLKGHTNKITCLEIIDNTMFISGSKDRTLRFWGICSGKLLDTYELKSRPIYMKLVDNRLLVGCINGKIEVLSYSREPTSDDKT